MSDELNARLNRFMDAQEDFNTRLMDEVSTIKRGVYGDPANGTKGLIQKQDDDNLRFELNEARIFKLENIVKAAKWIWTAVSVSVVLAWEVFGDHVKSIFK